MQQFPKQLATKLEAPPLTYSIDELDTVLECGRLPDVLRGLGLEMYAELLAEEGLITKQGEHLYFSVSSPVRAKTPSLETRIPTGGVWVALPAPAVM